MVEVFCTKSSTCVWKRLIVKEFNSYSSIIHRSKRDTSFVKLLFLNENYRNTAASRPYSSSIRARNLLSSPIIETYFHPSIWSFSRPNVSGRDPLIRNWNEFINLRGFIVFECAPPIPEAIKRSIAVKRLPEMCVVTENEARHWSVKSPDSVNVSIFRTTCFFDRLVSMCSAIECWFNAFFFFLSFFIHDDIYDDTVCSRREEIFRDGKTCTVGNVIVFGARILNLEFFNNPNFELTNEKDGIWFNFKWENLRIVTRSIRVICIKKIYGIDKGEVELNKLLWRIAFLPTPPSFSPSVFTVGESTASVPGPFINCSAYKHISNLRLNILSSPTWKISLSR